MHKLLNCGYICSIYLKLCPKCTGSVIIFSFFFFFFFFEDEGGVARGLYVANFGG